MGSLPKSVLIKEDNKDAGLETVFPEDHVSPSDASMALLQLRRHTRILLQQIVSIIANAPALKTTPNGASLAQSLMSRICLAADVHDSLMGSEPLDGIRFRLECLARGIVTIFCDSETRYQVMVACQVAVPARMQDTVLQMTFELVRSIVLAEPQAADFNRIDIDLSPEAECTFILKVSTDQTGLPDKQNFNESMTFVKQLASSNNADLKIKSDIGLAVQIIFHGAA